MTITVIADVRHFLYIVEDSQSPHILMKQFCCLLFLLLPHLLFSQVIPEIHSSRPRIWIDTGRVNWLRQNISSGECGETYADFVRRYNANWITDPELYLEGGDSTVWTWSWSSQYARSEAVYTAFLLLLTDDSLAAKRCRFIAVKAAETADTLRFDMMEWYEKETLLRTFSDAYGVLLDWTGERLPSDIRCRLADALYTINSEFMNTYITSSAGNSYVSSHNAYNCVQTMQNALVLYNDPCLTQAKNDTVWQWYTTVLFKWTNGFLPVYGYYRDTQGGWNWGAAYAMWSLTDQFKLFDNILYATGKDFFRDLPWVRNSINQYWYYIQPDNKCIHLGDGITRLTADNVIYRHASLFDDPRSVWMAGYYSKKEFLTYTAPVFNKLFYKDFTRIPASKPDPPHDWWSPRVGLAVSRTGWEEYSEMLWFFNSPSKRASHEHRDNNTFAVFKHAPLIIDAGYYDSYGSTHFINYYTRTIAHNTVCVFDSSDTYYYAGTPVSNDGGQVYSNALSNFNDIFKPENQRGEWLRFAAGTTYSYMTADAALSYDSSKLDRFIRRLFFHKPDFLLVLDHLHLRNTATRQRDVSWLLHMVHKPEIDGAMTASPVPGHIESFDGTTYTFVNGRGHAAVKTYLPEQTITTRIGGGGYEYWVDGTNYPPIAPIDSQLSTSGAWRIEVRPEVVQDSLVFLHAINFADIELPLSVEGDVTKNEHTIAFQRGNNIYLFPADGDTSVWYHHSGIHSFNGDAAVFALDLVPVAVFLIEVDGAPVGFAESDSNGILQTTIPQIAGNHTLTVRRDPSSIRRLAGPGTAVLDIYPNPAEAMVSISMYGDSKPGEIIITNTLGACVFRGGLQGNLQLDISNYPPGMYRVAAYNNRVPVSAGTFIKF